MIVAHVAMDDFLLVMLTIPLIDTSLPMDLYKVHYPPALHLYLGVQFS